MRKLCLAFAAFTLLATSCKKENYTADCAGTTKSFATDVSPIIQSTCATSSGCHASGSNEGPGALLTYAQIVATKSSIKSSVQSGSMPQGRTLSAEQKNAIICWIDNGAPNN